MHKNSRQARPVYYRTAPPPVVPSPPNRRNPGKAQQQAQNRTRTASQHRPVSRSGPTLGEAWHHHLVFPTQRPHCCLSHQHQLVGETYLPQAQRQVNMRSLASSARQLQTCHPTWGQSNRESEVLMNCYTTQRQHSPLIVHKKMALPTGKTSPHLQHPRQSQPDDVKNGQHRGVHRWRQSLEGGCQAAMRMDGKTIVLIKYGCTTSTVPCSTY